MAALAAMATEAGRSSMLNPGAHGLSEVFYAFASASNFLRGIGFRPGLPSSEAS